MDDTNSIHTDKLLLDSIRSRNPYGNITVRPTDTNKLYKNTPNIKFPLEVSHHHIGPSHQHNFVERVTKYPKTKMANSPTRNKDTNFDFNERTHLPTHGHFAGQSDLYTGRIKYEENPHSSNMNQTDINLNST